MSPVSVVPEDDHEINLHEQQTSSKQLRDKRGNNAFFEFMMIKQPCGERKKIGLKIPGHIY